MNRINNIFNKSEVENKLRNFKEGKDYKVSPVGDDKWFYDFLSDRLKIFWGGDRIVVNRVVETDSNKDYDYYGRFESYQDGGYRSFQSWSRKNYNYYRQYQNSESYRRSMKNNPFFRDPEAISESLEFGKIGRKKEAIRIGIYSEPNFLEKEKKYSNASQSQHWETCECGKRFDKAREYYGVNSLDEVVREVYCSHDCAEKYKSNPNGKIEYFPQTYLGKNDNSVSSSDLVNENQELRQQLAQVQKQLAKVLVELKKLKDNINGKDSEKLEQQIVKNEKLIKNSENISLNEVQEQVNKSQVLMQEFNVSSKDKNGNYLPYVFGATAIFSSAIFFYYLLGKNKRKK